MNLRIAAATGLALASLVGCGVGGDDPTLNAAADQRSFGLMSVTYVQNRETDGASPRLHLSTTAQFVRYSALQRAQLARLLALPLTPATDLPAEDHCELYERAVDLGQQGLSSGAEMASVELLEAGNLLLKTAAGAMSLVPRHYPGLLPFIFGVVYGEAKPGPVGAAGSVEVSSEGGEAVGPFRASAESPGFPQLQDLAAEQALGGALNLRWRGSVAPGTDPLAAARPAVLFYLELRRLDGGTKVLRCRPTDDGAFTLAPSLLAGLGVASGTALQLDLVRLGRTSFAAAGLAEAELQVSAVDRATLTLR